MQLLSQTEVIFFLTKDHSTGVINPVFGIYTQYSQLLCIISINNEKAGEY